MGNSAYTLYAEVQNPGKGLDAIVSWGSFGSIRKVNALRMNGANSLVNYWYVIGDTSSCFVYTIYTYVCVLRGVCCCMLLCVDVDTGGVTIVLRM